MKFNSFCLGIRHDSILLSDVYGNLMITDTLIARDLSLTFRDQKFCLNGIFINFPGWVSGEHVVLRGSADFVVRQAAAWKAFPGICRFGFEKETAYHFPGDIIMDLKFKTEMLAYKTFSAENVVGELNYKRRSWILNQSAWIRWTDLSQAMVSWSRMLTNLLWQEAISLLIRLTLTRHSNPSGISIRILSKPKPHWCGNGVTVNSSSNGFFTSSKFQIDNSWREFILTDGALIDFKPVQELSSFIHISELKNIHFEKLENDFS